MLGFLVFAMLCVYFSSSIYSKAAYFVKKLPQSEDSLEDNNVPNIWGISITKYTLDQPTVAATCISENDSTSKNKDTDNTTCIVAEKKDSDTQKTRDDTTSSIADSKPFLHYNKPLGYAVRYIIAWIELKKVASLNCLSEVVSEHLPDESVAKSILIELFLCHRTSRLQVMLDYMHKNTTINSRKLADSIAKLVLIAIHIPIDIMFNKQSPFCNILSLLTNSFLSTPHPFLCNYILYVLTSKTIGESIFSTTTNNKELDSGIDLDHFIIPNKKEETDKRPPSFLEVFNKNIFLTHITFKNSASNRVHLLSRYFKSQKAVVFEDDLQLLLFHRYSILALDKVRSLTTEILTLCNNFFGSKLDSKNKNTLLEVVSNDTILCGIEKEKTKDDNIANEKFGQRKSCRIPTIQQKYIDQVKFEDLLQLRKCYLGIRKKLRVMVVDESIDVFNKIYLLCFWGGMPQGTILHMEKIQNAYRTLVAMFDQLEYYIKVLELDFLFKQTCEVTSAYKTVANTNFKAITSVADDVPLTYENITKLRNSVGQCVNMAFLLEKVFQKYLEFSDIFNEKKDIYTAKVNSLCAACYEYGHQMKIVNQVLDKD
jgi:hypothetical protein